MDLVVLAPFDRRGVDFKLVSTPFVGRRAIGTVRHGKNTVETNLFDRKWHVSEELGGVVGQIISRG